MTCGTEEQKEMDISEKLYRMADTMVALLLPNLDIIHPEKGRDTKNPSGSANRIIPNSPTPIFSVT
jgi:hypothetical protein